MNACAAAISASKNVTRYTTVLASHVRSNPRAASAPPRVACAPRVHVRRLVALSRLGPVRGRDATEPT